jgi:micrococcal nuclease
MAAAHQDRKVVWRVVLLAVLAALLPQRLAVAACPVEPQGQRAVTSVIDGEHLRLDDGSELVLTGVVLPRAPDDLSPDFAGAGTGLGPDAVQTQPRVWPPAEAAATALKELAAGRSVSVGTLGRSRDRYGRLLGHVTVPASAGHSPEWLQAALVGRGLARVQPAAGQRPCTLALLALEAEARAAHRGLWASPAYTPLDAARPRDLLKREHGFVLVEGTVHTADPRRTSTYLNFGADRRQDFTVLINSALGSDRHFSPGGLAALAGRRIRVRGWIEYAGGPSIRVSVPEQIEMLD